jgi:hypothetical protein
MIYAKDRKILEPFQLVKGPTCHACKNGDNFVVVIYKKDSEAKNNNTSRAQSMSSGIYVLRQLL